MSCKECGKRVSHEYSYCPYCGTENGVTLAESMDNEKSQSRRLAELAIAERVFKKAMTWLGFAASVLTVAAVIAGVQLNTIWQNARQQVDSKAKEALETITNAENQARSTIERSKAVQADLDDARHVVVQVRKLRSDVNSLQSQVEGFYKTQVRELFGGDQKVGRYSGSPGKWVVTLQKPPIPASLIVRCGAIQLYPENYQLADSKLTVACQLNLNPVQKDQQDYIEVLYHSRN
jgi:hypothetical protein